MQVSNQQRPYYFYLWRKRIVLDNDKIVTRTCFGITSDAENRRNNYEGANGHDVEFLDLWLGPYRPVKELESRLKIAFEEQLVVGHRNFKYEWVNETIDYEQVKGWVEWELQNHPTIARFKPM